MFDPKATHIMIDLETLSTEPRAVILSIGAAAFSLSEEGMKNFHMICPLEEQRVEGRAVSASTLEWWGAQSQEAQEVFRLSETCFNSMLDCLDNLATFIHRFEKPYVWGMGTLMDIAILEDVYRQYVVPIPWTYKQPMCFRTLRELYSAEVPAPAFEGLRHHALADARHQASHLIKILQYVSGKETKAT